MLKFEFEFQFLLSMFILNRILSSSSLRKLPLCFGRLTAQITDRIKNASHMKRHAAALSEYVPFQNVLESLFNLLTERAQDYHAFSFADPNCGQNSIRIFIAVDLGHCASLSLSHCICVQCIY